jgi:hypothetical protein
MKKLQLILSKDEEIDKASKQSEEEVLRLLSSSDSKIIDQDQGILANLNFSLVLSPKDIRGIVEG